MNQSCTLSNVADYFEIQASVFIPQSIIVFLTFHVIVALIIRLPLKERVI